MLYTHYFHHHNKLLHNESPWPQQRSRNSSGTSIKSRRSETADLRKKSVGFESPDALSKQLHSTYEDAWLESMKQSFLTQYIQYLQSLSFVQVQTRPLSPKKLYVPNTPGGHFTNAVVYFKISFDP